MSSLLNTPIEVALVDGWRRIDPPSKVGFLIAVVVSVLAFGFEMTNLTLHHDDVNQIFIEDTILGHYLGRFGTGWLHYYVQGHFIMPFLQMAEGIALMAVYGVIVARFWGATKALDIGLVASLVCVFPYMAQVYQYNTSMATNSAAHLLAAAAVILSVRGRGWSMAVSVLLYFAAFSIYQGVATNAATVLLVWLLMQLLFPADLPGPWSRTSLLSTGTALIAVISAGALYLGAVSMMSIAFDSYQSAEKAFKPGAGINLKIALPVILEGTRSFFLWPEAYFPNALKKSQLVFLAGASLACVLLPRGWWGKGAALVLLCIACFAPRSLQLLHAEGQFHELTLTAYALVVSASVLIVLKAAPLLLRNAAALLAVLTIAAYVVQCNWISTVSHLNTLAHYTMMTQVLARVRSLPSAAWDGKTIAVVGEYDMKNNYPFKRATGVAAEFMRAYHMDKMAKLMRDEATFVRMDSTMPRVMEFAASHPKWPHPASVGVVDGIGVVVLSK